MRSDKKRVAVCSFRPLARIGELLLRLHFSNVVERVLHFTRISLQPAAVSGSPMPELAAPVKELGPTVRQETTLHESTRDVHGIAPRYDF